MPANAVGTLRALLQIRVVSTNEAFHRKIHGAESSPAEWSPHPRKDVAIRTLRGLEIGFSSDEGACESPEHRASRGIGTSVLKTILYDPQEPTSACMFDDDPQGRASSPWAKVRVALRDAGYDVMTPAKFGGRLRDVHQVIFENMPGDLRRRALRRRRLKDLFRKPSLLARCRSAGLGDRLAVALMEPAVVLPDNFDEVVHREFRTIYTWSTELLARGNPYRRISFLQPEADPPPDGPAFAQRRLLCNFSGNKTSSHDRELYSARVEVIRHMEQQHPTEFDHYGPGWDEDFHLWKGVVPDKINTMSAYRFNLSFENMVDEAGYITEKIFDSFRSGCVPIYLGAQDIGAHVPTDAFVDRRAFASTSELIQFLRQMPEGEWKRLRDAGCRFLSSEAYRARTAEGVAKMLLAGIPD